MKIVPLYKGQKLLCQECSKFKSEVVRGEKPFTYICVECLNKLDMRIDDEEDDKRIEDSSK